MLNKREYAEHRIQVAKVNIYSLRSQIREYEREIEQHEETLRGDPELGQVWCRSCRGTGLAGERETCSVCDGSGQVDA